MKSLYLKKGKEESLRRYHPWIFSGAVGSLDSDIVDGDVVKVYTCDRQFIAVGHFQAGSIAVRALSFDDVDINADFWRDKLKRALRVRQIAGLVGDMRHNATFRLVHGEGDGLPGLVVDCYGTTAVMQAHSVGMHMMRNEIAKALLDVCGDWISSVCYKSEGTLPRALRSVETDGFIYGSPVNDVAEENGLQFHIDWLKGQKTGFFIDQRDNRSLLEHYSQGRTVLNMFCYTGGFSVYAMRGGATLVHSVDSSERAVEMARGNVALNFPDDNRHEAFCTDAFHFLESPALPEYDLVVLDPPAFAKHRTSLHNALKGYIRLNARGLERVAHGGIMFTFSCSQVVTKEHFRNAVLTAATTAHRNVRILHQLHQPADHPISVFHPEGEYLKGLVLYVE